MSQQISPRRVLITGAAIGIGAACAEAFARSGFHVVLADVLAEEGEQRVAEIRAAGGLADFALMDVRDVDSVNAVVEAHQGDGFEVVIANAGIAHKKPFTELGESDWAQTLEVNLGGVARTFRAALGKMIDRGAGSLIAMSSISGIAYGWGEHAHYSASKSGVIGLVRALAVEFGSAGIRVNGIAPGYIRTAQSLSEEHSLGEAGLAAAANSVPLGRVGDPADVADVALFLASAGARYMTGQVLVVDGGLLVRQGS